MTDHNPPVIIVTTDRLVLRKMTEDDTDELLRIFSDPEAMKHFNVVFDRPRMLKWVNDNLEHQKQHGFSLWAVVLQETGEVIGDCGLETDTIEGVFTVGLGFDFQRKHWNQGYATEAARAVLTHAFGHYGLEKVSGWINPENRASRRVAEKIGMTVEKAVDRGGKTYLLYSIRKDKLS